MTTSARPQREHEYLTLTTDSTRWERYAPRAGDIVISTPPKAGTTWTQMICALLIFQSPDFGRPLSVISQWFDFRGGDIDAIAAEYETQKHRRFIKTHTPLDGLPFYDEVRYLYCGRDPRDIFFSFGNHAENLSDSMRERIMAAAGMDVPLEFPEDPNESFQMWLTTGATPWMEDGFPFGSAFYHTRTFWRFRHLPNILLLHYADLKRDREGEMRRIARFLDIEVPEEKWPQLVQAASFESMKARAAELAPLSEENGWKDNARFFHKGQSGQWQGMLNEESLKLYERLLAERIPPDMAEWLHLGRLGSAAAVD
ncbi:MAG TPA: sulfotransferase domain-containing protein [Candidatus Limnocylindrales bacterium]|nr:sulfotransferase domain-containing protein [Candidatus Limnocylindrales bacterium]